jgi:4'-phosphopantetheinyl transferase
LNESFALSKSEVHVWTFNTAREKVACDHLLSREEAEAARRLTGTNQIRFRNRRGALRLILSKYLLVNPASLEFKLGPRGKPYLVKGEVTFNLSHSEDIAAIAVARTCELGIDVEEVRRIDDHSSIAKNFFEREEIDALDNLPPSLLDETFLKIWVRKEAVLKAAGIGIADGLPIAVPTQNAARGIKVTLKKHEGRCGFYLYDMALGPRLLAALATCDPAASIIQRKLKLNDMDQVNVPR